MKKKLLVLLLTGLVLRLVLSVMGHNGDIDTYYIPWSQSIVDHGLAGFYNRNFTGTFANYPPLTIFAFTFFYQLYFFLDTVFWKLNTAIQFFPSQLVVLWRTPAVVIPALLKLPAIFADIGLITVIFKFAQKLIKNKQSALPLVAAALVLFNPAFFYNSSFWGQIDVIPLFFIVWSFYVILFFPAKPKTIILSAVIFAIGAFFKQTITPFIPLYLFVAWKKFGWRNLLKSAVIPLFLLYLLMLPFYKSGNILLFPLTMFWQISSTGGSANLTTGAYNFWGLTTGFGHIPDGPYRFVSLLFVTCLATIILYRLYRRGFKINDLLAAGFLLPWATFIFSTRMHERHMLLIFPFFLLATINEWRDRKVLAAFLFLSLFHFLNLYSSYWSMSILLINVLITVTIFLFGYFYFRSVHREPA